MTHRGPLALLGLCVAALGVACTAAPKAPAVKVHAGTSQAQDVLRLAAAARAASSAGDFAAAAKGYEHYLTALALDEDSAPGDYANGLTQLAGCYYRLKSFDRATATYREAVASETRRLGPDHEDVLGLESILASVELRRGNAPEAERILRKLLATEYRLHARGRREAATLLTNLAEALEAQGREPEATQCRQEAKDIRHKLCDEC